jgi:MFS family permease
MDESMSVQKKSSLVMNRNYMLLWIGQSLSLIGDYFFSATIALWIIERLARGASWLPLATGGVAMAATLPSLVLGPLAGVFVDRWPRRWTMIWTDGIRLILVLLFLLLSQLLTNNVVLLVSCFLIVLLIASGQQFFLPSRVALVADIVPREQHPQAYGSLQQAYYLAQIIGPSLAVPLYLALGPFWAFGLNAFSFLASFLIVLSLRMPAWTEDKVKERRGFWIEFMEGLRFFIGNRILVQLLISGMIFMFGGMAYNSFEYLYGVENLHVPAAFLGLYVGSFGIGVVLGLPLIASFVKRFGEVQVLWLGLVCEGLIFLVLSRVTAMIPGMLCGFFLGICSSSIPVTVRPLTVLVTPRALIGRVMAFEGSMITVAALTGGLIASVLASTALAGFHASFAGMSFGRLDTIFLLIGLLVVGAGIFARLTLHSAVKEFRAGNEEISRG